MYWEALYTFVIYKQYMIRNAKSLQEWTSCVVTHTIWQEKISFFYIHDPSNTIPRPFIRYTCKWFPFVWTSTTLTTWNMLLSGNTSSRSKFTINPFKDSSLLATCLQHVVRDVWKGKAINITLFIQCYTAVTIDYVKVIFRSNTTRIVLKTNGYEVGLNFQSTNSIEHGCIKITHVIN
jgi:hypothetical protein